MAATTPRTQTTGVHGDDASYQARVDYDADRYGAQIEHLKVGDDFNPEVGFLRRTQLRAHVRRTALQPAARRTCEHPPVHDDGERRLHRGERWTGRSRAQQTGRINVERENSDQFSFEARHQLRVSAGPFNVAPGVIIPPGGYNFNDVHASLSASASSAAFLGTRRPPDRRVLRRPHQRVGYHCRARDRVVRRVVGRTERLINDVSLPAGDFTTPSCARGPITRSRRACS